MSITIVPKGGAVPLIGAKTVRRAMIGLGWKPNEGQSAHKFDLDASLIARAADGEVIDVCYYKPENLKLGNWAEHSPDNLDGEGDGDDETLTIQLDQVPANIVSLDVVIHIYDADARGSQTFGMVEDCFARVENDQGVEIVRTNLSNDAEAFNEAGVRIARIRRDGPAWTFEAVHEFTGNHTLAESASVMIPV